MALLSTCYNFGQYKNFKTVSYVSDRICGYAGNADTGSEVYYGFAEHCRRKVGSVFVLSLCRGLSVFFDPIILVRTAWVCLNP